MVRWSMQWSADQLRIKRSRRPWQLAPLALLTVCWAAAVAWAGPITGAGLALLTVGGAALPALAFKSFRSFRAESHTLSRGAGRLLLDGEPLEIARLEMRVLKHPLFRTPNGYGLSLWALVGRGDPVDVEVGRFRQLLDASNTAGQLEEFLDRARARAPGLTSR